MCLIKRSEAAFVLKTCSCWAFVQLIQGWSGAKVHNKVSREWREKRLGAGSRATNQSFLLLAWNLKWFGLIKQSQLMSFKNYRLFSYLDLKLSSTVLSKYLFFISQSNNRNLFSKLNESLIISQFKHHN